MQEAQHSTQAEPQRPPGTCKPSARKNRNVSSSASASQLFRLPLPGHILHLRQPTNPPLHTLRAEPGNVTWRYISRSHVYALDVIPLLQTVAPLIRTLYHAATAIGFGAWDAAVAVDWDVFGWDFGRRAVFRVVGSLSKMGQSLFRCGKKWRDVRTVKSERAPSSLTTPGVKCGFARACPGLYVGAGTDISQRALMVSLLLDVL